MITEDQWTRFFKALARSGVIKTACDTANMHRSTVYDYIAAGEAKDASDEAKAWLKRFRDAENEAGDVIEEEMFRRAVEGVDEPLIGRVGKDLDGIITTVKRYSDALLVRLAQARRPEKFKDKVAQELSGPGGKPIQTESKIIALPMIDEKAQE